MYEIKCNHIRNQLAYFMLVLTRLVDGCEHKTEYSNDDDGKTEDPDTPLESALKMLQKLVDDMEQNEDLERAVGSLQLNIKREVRLATRRTLK